jgi:PAS domain S-box-containing protein
MSEDSFPDPSRLPQLPLRKPAATSWRYALAVLAAIAALLLRDALSPLFGLHNPYHTAWLAVVFSAWYCGVGPSIVTVVFDAIGIWYWFLPPAHSFAGKDVPEVSGTVGFVVFSAVIIALGESTRRSISKRQRAEEELKKAHDQLEDRVKERTAALEQRTAEVVEKAALLDMANDAILIKSADGKISYWNEGAERLYGWTMSDALGRTPGELLASQYPIPLREIEAQDKWEGELPQITRDERRIVVASRWTTWRDKSGKLLGWMEINTDITGRKRAEDAARSLSGRILTLQDDERRRMARGLHDSLGQYLAALKMQLDLLSMANDKQIAAISDCAEIANRCLAETRTVSHLLHPPLLDEAGFGSAARWYVEGFDQRSGIKVNLLLPENLGRLHDEIEIALFRALQEGLTNVHRHSGASAVDIRLELDAARVQLEIQDNGLGMPSLTLQHLREGIAETGIGIAGMRERVRELNGSLEIDSDSGGTLLRVTFPLFDPTEAMQPEKEKAEKENDKNSIPAA